jgi:nitrite reductase/ring-hydroxylating ferredoxin subunit
MPDRFMTTAEESPRTLRAAPSASAEGDPRSSSAFGLAAGWWPVAHSDEVRQHPGAFRLGTRALAVYRDLTGAVRAVEDRCPHRRLPLSMGRLTEDGSLQCPYHGWSFDGATGRCTAIPNLSTDERIPNGIKVAAFSAAENVAELLGYGLRTSKLAPPVGVPAADVPDAATTMYDARLDGGMVFVWTGAERPGEVGDTPGPGPAEAAAATGTFVVRSPHASVAEALLVNPGKALGLGALLGAGDELCSPTVRTEQGIVSVQRERYAYDLPRVSTFDPLSKRELTSTISTVAETGFTRVDVPAGRWTPKCHVTIGLTPIDTHRTVVRWRMALTGPGRTLGRAGTTAWSAGRRVAGRASDSAEALADTMPKSVDPGVLALRRARTR